LSEGVVEELLFRWLFLGVDVVLEPEVSELLLLSWVELPLVDGEEWRLKDPPRRLEPEVLELLLLSWVELLLLDGEERRLLLDGEERRWKDPPRDRPPLLRAYAAGVSKETVSSPTFSFVSEISPRNDKAIAVASQVEVLRFILIKWLVFGINF
jgi:hypothetical protein